MAMPDTIFASQSIPATFIGGRAFPVQKHIDYEWGPIAIQDPSHGSMYQIWRARMENSFVYLSAPNVPEFVLLDLPNVTEISFTFDQNANIIFVYVQAGVAKMWWFDTAIGDYTTTVFSGEVITPRITLDDKREMQRGISDVLLFYVRPIRNAQGAQIDGALMMRVQRERYLIEHVRATDVTGGVVKCGMMNNWRVGVQLEQYHAPTWRPDVNDDVLSLCHFDAENSDRVDDARLSNKWLLRSGARVLSSGKFGGCLDVSNNNYAVLFSNIATVGEGEYQVEFFTKMATVSAWVPLITQFGREGTNAVLFDVQKYDTRVILRTWSNDGERVVHEIGNYDFSSSFTHIAITFGGGEHKEIRVFVGGVLVYTGSASVAYGVHANTQIIIGISPGFTLTPPVSQRLIDEFRACSAISYFDDFAPPTFPFI